MDRRELVCLLLAAGGSELLPSPAHAAGPDTPADASAKEVVQGIGGFFFRAKDPKALALWYREHLGVGSTPTTAGDKPWRTGAGVTAFQPFPEKTGYFGDPARSFMLNFRVRDLVKMAAQLTAAGIEIKLDPEASPYGRFARLHDPEGNPIELWQPA